MRCFKMEKVYLVYEKNELLKSIALLNIHLSES
jgi:hypothetical protein